MKTHFWSFSSLNFSSEIIEKLVKFFSLFSEKRNILV